MHEKMARMTCQDVIGLMLEYLESTLDDDVVRELEAHLEGCEVRRHLAALLVERLRQAL
jgi:uncharacterized protein YeeX (DUF496 family)